MRVNNWSIRKCKSSYVLYGQILGFIPVHVKIKRIESLRIGLGLHRYGITYMCQYGSEDKSRITETRRCIDEWIKAWQF